MRKLLARLSLLILFMVAGSSSALAATPIDFYDFGEPKISGITVSKSTGIFPGLAIVNVKGYVIDLNPTGVQLPPTSDQGGQRVNGYILGKFSL